MVDMSAIRAPRGSSRAAGAGHEPMAGSNHDNDDRLRGERPAGRAARLPQRFTHQAEALVAAGNAVYANVGTLLPVLGESIPCMACSAEERILIDPVALGIGSCAPRS